MDYKLPERIENSNKSTYGRVLNIAGSDYMSGAAYLSSVSALKVGCGYCFLATTAPARAAVAAQTQNIVFVPLSNLSNYIEDADVIEIGCGLGKDLCATSAMQNVIRNANENVSIIVDADGLNLISTSFGVLQKEFLNRQFKNLIFTPHPKEAARLLGVDLDDVLNDVVNSAKDISKKYNCITVLKTNKTYIYSPTGKEYTNTTGNNSMAKAGSGDVLTGIISGLVAQGMDLFEACALGVYLHGLAGDMAAEKLTQYSVMADDIINCIPDAVKLYLSK